jgi:hypothetical protein
MREVCAKRWLGALVLATSVRRKLLKQAEFAEGVEVHAHLAVETDVHV